MTLSRWHLCCAALLVVLGTVTARAEDRDLAFIHGLVARGYPDVAVEYMNDMKDKPDLSAGAKDLWDLEMSKALRAQAQMIADPTERDSLNTKAQQFLEKFAKEKPNHPEALQAELTTAAAIMDQGNELLALARTTDDAKEKAAKIVAARKGFEQAKPLLERGLKKMDDRLAAQQKLKPPGPVGPAAPSKKFKEWLDEHNRLEVDRTQAEGRLALIDYYRAQTFTDPADNDARRKALGESFTRLDDIYQRNRDKDPNSLEGRFALLAHSWSGRAAEELGDVNKANDIYDEVLENFQQIDKANPKYLKTDVDDVLARTKHFSLMLMLKSPKTAKDYEDAAREFVQNDQYKKALIQEWGYQAAALELAKHILAEADKETKPSAKKKLVDEALKLLKEMAGVRSEFQREAIALRNKASGNAEETAQTPAEAMEYADTEIKKGNFERALYWLKQAKDLSAGKKIEPKDAAHLTELIAACELAPISKDFDDTRHKDPSFNKEKYLEWFDGFSKVARNLEYKKTDTARDASKFAVYCAAVLYGKAADDAKRPLTGDAAKKAAAERDEANKRLTDITGFVISTYPQSAEADDARMTLARTTLMDGKLDEALKAFESFDPKSEKYSDALIAAGKVRYQRYFAEKKKDEAKRDQKQMDEDRTMAAKHLSDAIALMISKIKPGDPYPDTLMETQVLLAQIYLEGNQNKEALGVLQPLVDLILKIKPTELSDMMVEVFRLGVRANLGLKNFDEAGKVGGVLIDLGPDNPRVNGTLVQFIQRVDAERRAIEKKLNELPDSTSPAELDRIRNDLQSIKTMLGNMLMKMSTREQLNATSMVYIGRLFGDLDMIDEAEKQFRNLLKKADDDPDFRKDAEKLFAWVRSKQVEMLRKRGKYQEALEQSEKLAAEYKGALEPLVAQAEILQAWAEKDPSKYDTAIGKWTEIRRKLERKNPHPPQYYDSVYNTAALLLSQAKKMMATNKEAALEKGRTGEKVINSLLIGLPNLDGTAETKAKFTKLKNQLILLRGGKPEANVTAPGVRPAPAAAAGASL
jgi:tetratricopeptide (TPR) repeat protein